MFPFSSTEPFKMFENMQYTYQDIILIVLKVESYMVDLGYV